METTADSSKTLPTIKAILTPIFVLTAVIVSGSLSIPGVSIIQKII
jgi:hypothetical protein